VTLGRFLRDGLTMAATGLATLIVFEIVFRFLPVATAPPVHLPTVADPIERYASNTPYTWSLGWNFYTVVRGSSNAQGWLADYDYDPRAATPLVAVAGDSMIEALHVSFADSLTGRLQTMLGTRGRAYAFAQSGAPLSQYVAYARHACETYHPQRLVVNVVGNDFDESVFTHRLRDGFFHLYERPDGVFDFELTPARPPRLPERVLRNSALALYLARNLKMRSLVDWFRPGEAKADSELERYVGMTSAAADSKRLDEGYRVIAWFLATLPNAACLAPREIVLVVDAARPHLYAPAALEYAHTSYFGKMRIRLISDAKARGFVVVDLEPYFLAAYAADAKRFEYPTDPHWDPHGHAVVAAAVREALANWPPLAAASMTRRQH
jgi:SGNH hydrolase-like domain, acetyltransferase AlgX